VSAVTQVASPPPKPLLIFDGDCTFCRYWIRRWQHITHDRIDYAPLQHDALRAQFPELARDQLERSVHLIEPDGRVHRGAEAVFRSQMCARRWPLWLYKTVPGVAPVTEAAYAFVAAHRSFFSLLTRLFLGAHAEPPVQLLVRRLFLSGLGIVYLIAFLSLGSQIIGLSGSNGIVPVQQVLRAYEQNISGAQRYYAAPTLCWFNAEDSFLRGQCVAGVILAVLLIADLAPVPCLFLLWLIYLSLSSVCTPFLGFQWDALLLEAGLLAIFLAPFRLWPNLQREVPPSRIALWLLRCLLFKLMFASGVVKLASGDVTWRSLTALTVHYETQPLPTWIAWYAHQLPWWTHKAFCAGMLAVELTVPFLIFLPRRVRLLAFWLFVSLQMIIALTGNYTFFNLLTIVLCLPLLDDHSLARFVPRKWMERAATCRRHPAGTLRVIGIGTMALVATVWIAVSSVELLGALHFRWSSDSTFVRLYRVVAPLRSINGYGLFAVMTTSRPEIIVEGSNDGVTWLPYEFKYKPGDVKRRPRFVAPHQPRLDWQMWFAALGDVRHNPWFINFCVRLLEGKPEVLALIKTNPFPDRPPKYVRARLYDYRFTNFQQRRADGSWWRREYKGEYCPPLSLNRE
jgi:predicted DCC family thiol-disulfide oxidoreductase YuxK